MTAAAKLPPWLLEERPSDRLEVPVADADPVNLFLALDTQWHRHPLTGHRTGIDYSSIRPTAELLEVAMSPDLMADIRMMEAAALSAFAKAMKR